MVGALMAVSSLGILAPALTPPATAAAVVAVYPPGWSRAQALSAASQTGDAVEPGRLNFLAIARSQTPGLPARLKKTGALLILDLQAGACGKGRSA